MKYFMVKCKESVNLLQKLYICFDINQLYSQGLRNLSRHLGLPCNAPQKLDSHKHHNQGNKIYLCPSNKL